jgi:bifunctional DNase/RNase
LINYFSSTAKIRFSKILINKSNNFSLILLSDAKDGVRLIPDAKEYFEAQAIIQTIHNASNQTSAMQGLIHKTIINTSQKMVSDVSIKNVEMENIVASITFWHKRRRKKVVARDCEVVALNFNSCTPGASRETILKHIEEVFLAEIRSRQGIMADNIWLELDGDTQLKTSPPELLKLLRKLQKIDNLLFFFEGRPHWKQKIISLI